MTIKRKKKGIAITDFFQTIFNNAVSQSVYYDKLREITISLYKWLNLPPEIDEQFMETVLFDQGNCLFFYDDIIEEYIVARSALKAPLNIYNLPTKRRAYASNGYQYELDIYNSVLIFNNNIKTSSQQETLYYADKIGFYDRIIDININALKTPLLIKCSENKRLSMKNIYMKYDGNEPIIWADDSLSVDPVTVLKTDAPFVADKIYELKAKYWNEFLTYKGISNINVMKKERMTNDEVYRQLGGSFAARGSGMQMRKQAAKKINEMFGLEIDVVFNEEYQMSVNDVQNEIVDPADQEREGSNE